MTSSELKAKVEFNTTTYFFSSDAMKFFGDTLRNFGVRSDTIISYYNSEGDYVGLEGIPVEVWELYRKKPVKHGLKKSHYFDKKTFESVSKV